MDVKIHQDLKACSKVMEQDSYKKFIDSTLSSWHRFIPDSHDKHMLPSNCWYTNSFKHVPTKVTDRLLSVFNFNAISRQFQQSEAKQILEAMLTDNKSVKFEVISHNQKPSGEAFCLPMVYLPGFPKCGTTTLYNLLTSHPDVKSIRKEGQFWGNFVIAPNKVYQDLEALLYTYRFKDPAKEISHSDHLKVVIDGSTHTVYDSSRLGDAVNDMCMIPVLLHKLMPNTKIIIMLRNPTSRLWSHYWFYCSKKRYNFYDGKSNRLPPVPDHIVEKASERFHNDTVSAIDEFNDCIQSGASEFKCTYDAFYDDDKHSLACGKSRIGVSLYYFHIVKWLSVFPREQLLFLTMAELAEDSYAIASTAWKFIGLDPVPKRDFKPLVSNKNTWIISNKYKDSFKMWPETKELLNAFFYPFNQRLAKLLDDQRFLWT